jgi:hypothetical protein
VKFRQTNSSRVHILGKDPFGKQGNAALEWKMKDNTETGKRLAALNCGVAVSEAMVGLLPTEDITDLTTGTKTQNVTPNALTNAFVSVLRQPVEQQKRKIEELKGKIEAETQQADRLRLELEMMTGEFTGLSLPDVVFTILGLFLVERKDLVAMLDSSTLDQMKKDTVLKTAVEKYSGGNAVDAIANLETKVKDLYTTLDEAIKLRSQRSERTGKSSTALSSTKDEDEDSQTSTETTQDIKKGNEKSEDSDINEALGL